MCDDVDFKWFIMEPDGNGAIRKASVVTGPYYNTTEWFRGYGYTTLEDAKYAVRAYCKENGNRRTLFIVEGT